jgi:hypothetical protein
MPFDGMPFNGTTLKQASTKPISLSDIGLIPIDPARAIKWRTHVVQCFAMSGRRQAGLVEMGLAHWETSSFRLNAFSNAYQTAYAMPKIVRQLVNKIAFAFPNAQCTVAYFDTDPILYVHIGQQRHCVAIWDRGVVRAIAQGVTLPLHQRVLRRFVDTV